MKATQILNAIRARVEGEWDNADLVSLLGPCSTDALADVHTLVLIQAEETDDRITN